MDQISRWKWHFVGGLVALGLLFPWPILSDHSRLEIEKHLQQTLGMVARIQGPIAISLLPRPYIQISAIRLSDPLKRFLCQSVREGFPAQQSWQQLQQVLQYQQAHRPTLENLKQPHEIGRASCRERV